MLLAEHLDVLLQLPLLFLKFLYTAKEGISDFHVIPAFHDCTKVLDNRNVFSYTSLRWRFLQRFLLRDYN